MLIKPTVGRSIYYFPILSEGDNYEGPYPAIITRVWSDNVVNIGGFTPDGRPFGRTTVAIYTGDLWNDDLPARPYAMWMPHQIQQAEQAEQAEQAAETQETEDPMYKIRMRRELVELTKLVDQLSIYLNTNGQANLTKPAVDRLIRQYYAMCLYQSALQERVEADD